MYDTLRTVCKHYNLHIWYFKAYFAAISQKASFLNAVQPLWHRRRPSGGIIALSVCLWELFLSKKQCGCYFKLFLFQSARPSSSVNSVAVQIPTTCTARSVTKTKPSSNGTTVTRNVNVSIDSFLMYLVILVVMLYYFNQHLLYNSFDNAF